MTAFRLDATDVGARVLAAIQREAQSGAIDLSCRGARFRERVELDGIAFSGFDVTEARFDRGLALTRCTVMNDALLDRVRAPHLQFDRVAFEATTYLRGARIAMTKIDDVTFVGYASFDDARLKQLTLRDVSFGAEARFRQLACADNANLRRVTFRTVASFQQSRWGSLRFAGCEFGGPTQMTGASVRGRLGFVGCRLVDCRIVELQSGEECELRETTFERPLNLRVIAPRVDASHTSFERGVDLVLSRGAELDLAGASLGGPSLIMTEALSGGSAARLKSLEGARLAGLTLRALDLGTCSFARAHTLDDVVISGRGQLRRAPWAVGWLRQREVIVDEVDFWHTNRPRRSTRSARDQPGREMSVADPSTLAETYRALRRGRENAKDRPGAADFYYGEMEMRRRSAVWVDRIVLDAYWIVSGYGLRASRALLAYLVVVCSLATALEYWGLNKHASFLDVLVYVLATTTVLQKASLVLALNTVGDYLQVIARLIGPALFALMLLALRSRVRR